MTATTLADWRAFTNSSLAAETIRDFPCRECGQPSVGWCVSETEEDGMETLTGWSCCEAHIPEGLERA